MKNALMRGFISDELARGQVVIVLARWLLVLAGLLVALWQPQPLGELRVQIGVLLLVAIGNFFMHAQILRRRPTLQAVAYAASAADLAVITLLIATQGGFQSNLFVFYFPALLAISVAFRTHVVACLSGFAIVLYSLMAIATSQEPDVVLLRALMLAGTAVIGNVYWRLHRSHIQASTSARREEAQDLFFGQAATLWARWFVIIGGALLVLARASTTNELALAIAPIIVLLVLNFFLHGRYLIEKPANRGLTLLASALDLAVIAGIVLAWPGSGGLSNPNFVFWYPVIFAFALVFPPRTTWAFTAAMLFLYVALTAPSGLSQPGELKMLVVRLITMAAVGGLGSVYWRIVRREVKADGEAVPQRLAWRAAEAS